MCRSRLPLLLLLLLTAARASTPTPLPHLRTARQVHALSRSEADRGLPVLLRRAQITALYGSGRSLFLIDASGGVFVRLAADQPPDFHPGDLVRVEGCTSAARHTPIIVDARLRRLGRAALPEAPLVSFDQLSSGGWDSRWVSVEGIVRSAALLPGDVPESGSRSFQVTVASGEERLDVRIPMRAGPLPVSLVDARVRLRAAVGSRFNLRRQLTGVLLYMPSFACLRIVSPAPANPFALPQVGIADITRVPPQGAGHRVHIRGLVSSAFDNGHFSLLEDDYGIFVTAQDPTSLRPGDRVDVVGFPSNGDYTSYLDQALVRRLGSGPLPPPVQLTASEALAGTYDADPIELEALLLDHSRDRNGLHTLLLTNAGQKFLAVLPPDTASGFFDSLHPGSTLRLRGICVIHTNGTKTPQSFDLLLRSSDDIQILRTPPWWTPRHTLLLAALLSVLLLIIFTRNLGLRHRVAAQTRQIQSQLDESRTLRAQAEAAAHEKSQALASLLSTQHDLLVAQEKLRYQATHDALTSLWNRAALLDFLHKEVERALRTGAPLGVLLLDVDHFKTVNDTHGHLTGDAVLREIGRRILRSTRLYDIAGRYGGEEFLILLPGCDNLQTERSAERIRAAICVQPFHAGDAVLSLTASIGATVAFSSVRAFTSGEPDRQKPECPVSDTELLSCADCALYEAKSSGRNRTVLRLPEPVAALPS
ncbi:MAG TPA: diguanylate cyclase [Acidobacteriaceae bacterium]